MAPLSPAGLELLEWLSLRPRSYEETISAWQSHCPRFTTWEDALANGYVRPGRHQVVLTERGRRVLAQTMPNARLGAAVATP
jgi:hypothetical protein